MLRIRNALERLKNENDWAAKKLGVDAFKSLRMMTDYVRAKGVGMYEAEVFRKDMIGMLLEAKARGEKLGDVLGEDVGAFSERVAQSAARHRGETALYMLYHMAIMLLAFSAAQFLMYPMAVPVTPKLLVFLVFFSVLGLWSGYYSPRYTYVWSWGSMAVLLVPVAIVSAYALALWTFGDTPVFFTVNWFVPAGAHLAFFIAIRWLWCRHINRVAAQENIGL